jgi:AraC-like DNA-binding protein
MVATREGFTFWPGRDRASPSLQLELVVKRLADILFIQSIRAHIASRSESCKKGLLRAIFDPQNGSSPQLHARESGRSLDSRIAGRGMRYVSFRLAVRFKELVGETPLEYLTSWRMHKATALLHQGDKKLFEVAKSVGYDSDAAFSKAFKRILGVAPREYRRGETVQN